MIPMELIVGVVLGIPFAYAFAVYRNGEKKKSFFRWFFSL